jgi:abortive infection bacteriophage resistance protein
VALRNCIAHHSRTWNRRYPLKPQLPDKLADDWINATITPTAKLYAQLSCLAYLQNATHPGNDFKHQLKSLLQAHPNVDVTAMGFPKGWENEPLWKA